jgi:hypothetical protein
MAPTGILARIKSLYTKHQGMPLLSSDLPTQQPQRPDEDHKVQTCQLTARLDEPSLSVQTVALFSVNHILFCPGSPNYTYIPLNSHGRAPTLTKPSPGRPYFTLRPSLLPLPLHQAFTQSKPRCALRHPRADSRCHWFMSRLLTSCAMACR